MYGSRLSIRCASTATYAVLPSKCDASIFDTTPHAGIPVMFLLTSFHFAPPSREYHTLPSLVPAHTTPFSTSENAIAKTTNCRQSRQPKGPRFSAQEPGNINTSGRIIGGNLGTFATAAVSALALSEG